ncbi:ATPase family AAA domain-containing protein 5 isoform X1 [Alosa pseudoharengus]|uniref:ATPase family AAA domain-containing protein 5 isoform X1 n=1 Tax=Alosa pseudoharengus TaxID=34774 RepID=UPI003F8A70BD
MAGVIAMASVIEDFETQPCKKRKKDSDAAGVKTITNYFTPVAKTVEKPFSPPRSSNIMDYFKKTPSATNAISPLQQSKENELQPVEAVAGSDHAAKRGKPPSKKPGRKAGRTAKKALAMNPPESGNDCILVSSTAQSEDPPADSTVTVEDTGSTASLTQNNGETVEDTGSTASLTHVETVGDVEEAPKSNCADDATAISNKDATLKDTSDSGTPSVRTDPKLDGAGLPVCSTPEEKGRRGRAARKNGRGGKADSVQCDVPETQECSEQQPQESSVSRDAGLEEEEAAAANEESQLNLSTVTVSFEDFLKSHSPKGAKQQQQEADEVEGEEETEAGGTRLTLTSVDQAADRLSVSKPSDEGDQPPTQVSPRTLTIQAEVHAVSPDQDLSRASDRKVCSIFTTCRRSKDKAAPSPQSQENSEPHPAPPRKSNVVLQEEDLELAVLEAASSSAAAVPKCSQAERKQFMNAFKQPAQDTAKGKAGKAAGKQKQQEQPAEGAPPADVEEEKEEVDGEGGKAKGTEVEMVEADPKPVELKGAAQKAARKKRGRPKKEQRTTPEEPTPPAALPADAEAPTAREAGEALPSADQPKSTPTATETRRRSGRELARKQSTPDPLTPSSESKHAESTSKPQSTPAPLTPSSESKHAESTSKPQSTPAPLTPSSESKHAESTSKPQELPSPASTPKTHRPKRNKYQSHMLVPPDDKGSPIRMKFTRVFISPGETSEFDILSPLAKEDSKKRKKAQKLVQKAKAFQQSRQEATEEKAPLRRSSRRQDTAKRNYCEPEDPIICLENDEDSSTVKTEDTKAKKQNQVRSLNDVLGKNTPGTKVTKSPAVAGAKVGPLFTGKKPQRPSAVISIFDDSSRDASDASLDDEQFRARREFLKSGLPESFKKQIAKTAASREAYTLSCSSFQMVVHVLQRAPNCPLWSLPWPACPRLGRLKEESGALVLRSPLSAVGPLGLGIVPAQRSCREQLVSGWREDLSPALQRWLVEEISRSNPSFPTQRIFTQLLKRRAEQLLKPTAPDTDSVPQETARSSSSQPVGGKRKREENERDAAEKVSKKQRSSRKEPETITIPDDTPEPPRRGRGARGRPRRQQQQQQQQGEGEEPKAEVVSTPAISQKDDVIVLDSPSPSEDTATDDVVREDVMWTEKYQPQHSSDVIGNMQSVRRLHSWLREWKLRADREERKKQQEKKQEDDLNDSWLSECGEEEDLLCNTLLITGPTGVGKTAAVYACAQELGFKVFEVNCSSQRSGRQILSQLKEATQSHQVDIQGVNAHKPTFFNSYSSSSGGGSGSRPGSSPRKVNSPRRVVSSPHKPPQSPRLKKRGSLAPTSLANFFKMGGKPSPKEAAETNGKKPRPACMSPRKRVKPKEASCSSEDQSATPPAPAPPPPAPSTPAAGPAVGGKAPGDEQGKRTATSLILFEEVDVIFDDDTGFLAAIKTFMATTKRPVILTTSDPNFRTSFDGYFDEINFETPSVEHVSSYLRLLCLAENVRVSAEDVASLLRCTGGDVRQSLLQLQCWVRSGAGPGAPHTATQSLQVSGSEAALEQDGKPDVPPCDAGCTASLLGLLNVQLPDSLLEFIKCESASPLCWELLAETERRGFDLLYSNMEVLLPLPTCPLRQALPRAPVELGPGQTAPSPAPTTSLPPQPANPNTKPPLLAETEEEASPLKVSSRMRQKKQCHPGTKDPFQSDSDSDDGFLSLCRPASVPRAAPEPLKEEEAPLARPVTERRKRVELTEAERKRSGPVSIALGAMAEFLEHMSALDSYLTCPALQEAEGACVPAAASGWAQAEIRSGLTDEPRLGAGGRSGGCRWAAGEEQVREIRAAMESLSFRRCRAGVEQAWGAAQALEEEKGVRQAALDEITLPTAPHRQTFNITPDNTLCQPGLPQRRCDLVRSVCSSKVGTSSRAAIALDILPTLRTICRSEQLKEQGKVKRRFLHYLEGINLGLPKQTLQLLAADFP